MKKILVLIIVFMIFDFFVYNSRCNSQWKQQYYSGNYIALNAIQFLNDNTGYIVGEDLTGAYVSIFLKTTNGGTNWNRINLNVILEDDLYSLSFINVNTGFVCGRNSYIRKTTDGGQTWASYLAATNTPNFNAIQFLDEQTGYVGGRYGMRAKSTNGGVNWTPLDTALTHIDFIHFFDVNTGIMGDANSGIYRTTNGGTNWSFKYQTDSNGAGYDYINSSFINNNTGYVIGTTYYKGILLKTTNKGIDWSIIRTIPNQIGAVYALNNSTIYIGGYLNYILCSTDSGLTWSKQYFSSANEGMNSICFINDNTGFCCGMSGNVYMTTNGGVRVENISTEIPSSYSLGQNYPNPFNPTTKIKFSIVSSPHVLSGDLVQLKVYDVMGREVQTLVNESLKPGTYEVIFDGSLLNSGVYFYTIYAETFTITKKMMLIR